jgi:hypothetical protein
MLERIGGPDRDRTDDLFHAMEARSQTAPQAHMLLGIATTLFSLHLLDSSMQWTCSGQR